MSVPLIFGGWSRESHDLEAALQPCTEQDTVGAGLDGGAAAGRQGSAGRGVRLRRVSYRAG